MARILVFKPIARDKQKNRSGTDQIAETFFIATDAPVSQQWIERHSTTPKLNGPAAGYPGYYWDDVKTSQKALLCWEMPCSATPFQFTDEPDSPLALPAKISGGSELVEEPTLFDADGRPIVTTAGEWIAGVTREIPVLTYSVQKNLGKDPAWMATHMGAVNREPIRIRGRMCAPFTLMLRRVAFTEYQIQNRVNYSTFTLELHYDPRQWIKRLWNVGTIQLLELPSNDGKKRYIQARIRAGVPLQNIETPVPLDLRGRVIEGVLTPDADSPVDVTKLIVLEKHVQPVQTFTNVLPLV